MGLSKLDFAVLDALQEPHSKTELFDILRVPLVRISKSLRRLKGENLIQPLDDSRWESTPLGTEDWEERIDIPNYGALLAAGLIALSLGALIFRVFPILLVGFGLNPTLENREVIIAFLQVEATLLGLTTIAFVIFESSERWGVRRPFRPASSYLGIALSVGFVVAMLLAVVSSLLTLMTLGPVPFEFASLYFVQSGLFFSLAIIFFATRMTLWAFAQLL